MQLLVSVSNAGEAIAAAAGGADVIDAKDPARGALGAVSPATFGLIRRAVTQPTSAALGDAAGEAAVEHDARVFHAAGAAFVKIGFAGTRAAARTAVLLASAVRGAPGAVIAVAYADADRVGSPSPDDVLEAAGRAGATGILLDTADKHGPGLCHLISQTHLTSWINAAHQTGLVVAVAGRLRREDLAAVRDAGADIAGVRGAACAGNRTSAISTDRVRLLRSACA